MRLLTNSSDTSSDDGRPIKGVADLYDSLSRLTKPRPDVNYRYTISLAKVNNLH